MCSQGLLRCWTRPWYASRSPTRRRAGEESQRAGGEHKGGATARTAKRNEGHPHRAGPPEGRADATARDDTARDDTDVTSVRARTSSTHAPQRRVAGPTRPNRARGLFWCALSRGGASEGRIGAVVARVGNQHRCRLGCEARGSNCCVRLSAQGCCQPYLGCVRLVRVRLVHVGLAVLLDEAVVFVWVTSAVESDISTASIQRAEKRPETV